MYQCLQKLLTIKRCSTSSNSATLLFGLFSARFRLQCFAVVVLNLVDDSRVRRPGVEISRSCSQQKLVRIVRRFVTASSGVSANLPTHAGGGRLRQRFVSSQLDLFVVWITRDSDNSGLSVLDSQSLWHITSLLFGQYGSAENGPICACGVVLARSNAQNVISLTLC